MTPTTSTQKVRRLAFEGKRAQGHQLQLLHKVRRPDPFSVHVEANDPSLTAAAGLVGLARWIRRQGVDAQLKEHFGALKRGPCVVYPMATQLRLLMDLQFTGRGRVFDLESCAADPLFIHLAGGYVPSIDTLYDDLARFDDPALETFDAMVSEHGLAPLRAGKFTMIHLASRLTPPRGRGPGAPGGGCKHGLPDGRRRVADTNPHRWNRPCPCNLPLNLSSRNPSARRDAHPVRRSAPRSWTSSGLAANAA